MKLVLLLFFFCSTLSFGQPVEPSAILEKLLVARGEKRTDYPEIKVLDRQKNIAAYSPITNTIILEKKAVEICNKMGNQSESALAFIISHELTHFFQHKIWSNSNQDIAFFTSSANLENSKSLEIEADTYGAFLCYLAGYDFNSVAPKIIEQLYESYQINVSTLTQYPKPHERMELTQTVCERVTELKFLFEAAQVLSHFGVYLWSNAIYSHISKYLDFKEVYNNLGVNALKSALAYMPEALNYPLVIKTSLGLRSGGNIHLDSLLNIAEFNLKLATEKDPTDHDLFVNLASTFLAKNEYQQFNDLNEKLKRLNISKNTQTQLKILEGIMLHKLGERKKAIHLFSEVKSNTSDKFFVTTCKENIKRINNKFSKNPPRKFGKELFIPKFTGSKTYSERIIDLADPLFPKKVQVTLSTNGAMLTLKNGLENITLIQSTETPPSQPVNRFKLIQASGSSNWYMIGK